MHVWKPNVAFQRPARLSGFERSRVIRGGHFEEVELVWFVKEMFSYISVEGEQGLRSKVV